MNAYEFELHSTNQPNKLITIEANTLMIAYDIACEMYPDVLAIVPTDPTIDLY